MRRSDVIQLTKQIGLRPQTAAGQNFLLSENVAEQMVKDAEVISSDTVLEIGPGLGILTEQLLKTGAKVVAVELDQRLAAYVQQRFQANKNLIVIQDDIFKVKLPDYFPDGGYKLVANLPYSATSLVFRNFLSLPPRPNRMTVMIQKEVAERIVAKPGEMSLLSLMTQYYSAPRMLGIVPRSSFWPVPKVTSAVIDCPSIERRDPVMSKAMWRVAKAGFASKRKQLINSLAVLTNHNKSTVEKILAQQGLDPTLRPQDLTVQNWLTLAQAFL